MALVAACTPGTPSPDGGTNACPTATGAGTQHSISIAANETWTAAASPHIVPTGLTIPAGVTLTLDPCATVRLGSGAGVEVNGRLVANGTSTQPVRIQANDATQPWGTISATRTAAPAIELHYTLIEGGGAPALQRIETQSAIMVRGHTTTAGDPMILVDHVELRGSRSAGIMLLDAATFVTGSTALTVTGSAWAPVVMNGFALTSLPDGTYAGNTLDRLVITTHDRLGVPDVAAEIVMHRRDVPYLVGAYGDTAILTLGAATGHALTTLRIEAGSTLRWPHDFGLVIASVSDTASGELIAQGTVAEPVTFTSDADTPRAGDWRGIMFAAPPGPASLLDHVHLAFAGSQTTETSGFSCGTPPAPSQGGIQGALTFATSSAVTRQILTNSVIDDSGSNGIDRGWTGGDVDYLATNTLARIAFCSQTLPKPMSGSCPSPAPCPTAP